ncbi:SCP2 sterol-binding domain-containing protein [Halopseudomonas nanhaiensis]|uniref:ubiquinone anaerobic biosynthesis accessory factor UbiT n=1 Tax=Halopseudomonas nanhaiensis TaxID=2830842 RepID=UPI001CBDE246|nr:SCP2 sterol-binding domain-containing protein [Halopseudomonas nanhaiensis]UAW99338.1 SCP2 sterol-binding domain-containing protein [Halopseudomonas nanhaiensis]
MLTPAKLALRMAEPVLPLGRHVPFSLQKMVLERAVAKIFAQPLADGQFDVLYGRWLRLEVEELELAWNLTRDGSGLRLAETAPADVIIRGRWRDFLLMVSRQEDPDTLFFRRRLVIEGDTELGLAVKNLIDSLDPELLPPRLWQAVRWLGAAAADPDGLMSVKATG